MMVSMRNMPPYLRLLWDHFQQGEVKNIQVVTGRMWVMCRVYNKFTKNVQNNQEHKSLSRSKLTPLKITSCVIFTTCPASTCMHFCHFLVLLCLSFFWMTLECLLVGREFDQFWRTWWFWMKLECLFLWVENLINLDELDELFCLVAANLNLRLGSSPATVISARRSKIQDLNRTKNIFLHAMVAGQHHKAKCSLLIPGQRFRFFWVLMFSN